MRVRDNADESRYELELDGELAGVITYRAEDGVVTMLHAEVDEEREGEGLGSQLVREALDDVRARGLKVRPQCPFVAAYVRRHDEYQDLVAP